VNAGQYKYNKDLFDMSLEKKMYFKHSIFSKEAPLNAFLKCFINFLKMFAGHILFKDVRAGRTLPRPVLEP